MKQISLTDAIKAVDDEPEYPGEMPIEKLKEAIKTGVYDPKICVIKSGRYENLDISLDYDTNPKKQFPVLLYTPNMKNTNEHFHICLNRRETRKLHKYLGEYLRGDQ